MDTLVRGVCKVIRQDPRIDVLKVTICKVKVADGAEVPPETLADYFFFMQQRHGCCHGDVFNSSKSAGLGLVPPSVVEPLAHELVG